MCIHVLRDVIHVLRDSSHALRDFNHVLRLPQTISDGRP
jgi:hypothetical protein